MDPLLPVAVSSTLRRQHLKRGAGGFMGVDVARPERGGDERGHQKTAAAIAESRASLQMSPLHLPQSATAPPLPAVQVGQPMGLNAPMRQDVAVWVVLL